MKETKNAKNDCPFCGHSLSIKYEMRHRPTTIGTTLVRVGVMCRSCQIERIKQIKYNKDLIIIEAIKDDGTKLIPLAQKQK